MKNIPYYFFHINNVMFGCIRDPMCTIRKANGNKLVSLHDPTSLMELNKADTLVLIRVSGNCL